MNTSKPLMKSFLSQVFFVVVIAAGIVGGFFSSDSEVLKAAVAGIVLSLFNVLAGYAAIEISFDKSYTQFIQIVIGGVLFRLFVMAAVLVLLIAVFHFHVIALIVALFGLYVVFLGLEVIYIYGKWQKKINS